MGAPKRLEAGTRVVKVLADIVGGSNSTFTMHLWNAADVTVVDTQLNSNVLSDLVSDGTFTKRSSGEQTVNAGTLTVTKMTDSPSGDIVDGASNATLAKFELKAAGEKVKIETLYISAVVSTSTVASLRQQGGIAALNISHVAHIDHKYTTPSGKVEFYSKVAEDAGLPPLPTYQQKPDSGFPLELRSGRTLTHFHSFYDSSRALPKLAKLEKAAIKL